MKLGTLDEQMSRTQECILTIMTAAGFILQVKTNGTVHVLEIRQVLQKLPEAEADGTKGQACVDTNFWTIFSTTSQTETAWIYPQTQAVIEVFFFCNRFILHNSQSVFWQKRKYFLQKIRKAIIVLFERSSSLPISAIAICWMLSENHSFFKDILQHLSNSTSGNS